MKLISKITEDKELEYYTENNEYFGTLRNSVGRHGTSDGAFISCLTTTPFNELGVTHIDGVEVLHCQ